MLVPFPPALAPPAPFPLVIDQSATSEDVAPGVRRATYRLRTTDGPLVVHLVAIDSREPTIRIGTVVASDRLISHGESLSSMARRTNAVAGVNADYFDIGATYQPLNVVVRDGALLRTPSKRIALDVRADRSVRLENFTFTGEVRFATTTLPLTSVNEWPPQGGATFLTPAYGSVPATSGVRLAELVPQDVDHDPARVAGIYRIASIGPARTHTVTGAELGFGPAALAVAAPPAVGDAVEIVAATTPALEDVVTAVGGGPLLVASGVTVDDPSAPAPEERDRRFPVSGAVLRGDALLLVEVDGRTPAQSIGLTRPQFAALALGLGGTDAMAFDSGGSAELVARTLGEPSASVFGSPSDGEERRVADGLFVYSDAPLGRASRLVVRPESIAALANARVPLRASLVDAAGHALGDVRPDGGDVVHVGTTSGRATVRARGLVAEIPVDVVPKLARLELDGETRAVSPNGRLRLHATGYDERGRTIALGDAVTYAADRGSVEAGGEYRATDRDATIVARAAGARATLVVRVGRHSAALPFFDDPRAQTWRYATAPAGRPGALTFARPPAARAELALPFDFTHDQRATYASAPSSGFELPGEPFAFSIEIASDVRGVGVRASFVNRLGETRALTLVPSIDWDGYATRTIELPHDLNPPVRLASLYVVDSLGPVATRAAGTLRFRNPSAIVLGTP
ncbi:MAG: hypothetical protein NVSMB21_03100 [Vulcanimicrobiaceae bacterium]